MVRGQRRERCHWGSEVELEIAGTMVAHSLLLGGPGFPCIHPGVYHMLVFGDCCISNVHAYNIPASEDIRQDASTIDLLEMISNVCALYVVYYSVLYLLGGGNRYRLIGNAGRITFFVRVPWLPMSITCHPHTGID